MRGEIRRILLKQYRFLKVSLILLIFFVVKIETIPKIDGYSVSRLLGYWDISSLQEQELLNEEFAIAIIDTGISDHPDLKENIIFFKDFVNGKSEPYDDNGHGTKVSGIIAGKGILNSKFIGVYPEASLIALKAFEKEGRGNLLTFSQAVEWIIENSEKHNIRLLCIASGFPNNEYFDNRVMEDLIKRLVEKNIVVVTSTGNNGVDGEITLPGVDEEVLTVGSISFNPQFQNIYQSSISDFTSLSSSKKDKPDLFAPGELIITTDKDGCTSVNRVDT